MRRKAGLKRCEYRIYIVFDLGKISKLWKLIIKNMSNYKNILKSFSDAKNDWNEKTEEVIGIYFRLCDYIYKQLEIENDNILSIYDSKKNNFIYFNIDEYEDFKNQFKISAEMFSLNHYRLMFGISLYLGTSNIENLIFTVSCEMKDNNWNISLDDNKYFPVIMIKDMDAENNSLSLFTSHLLKKIIDVYDKNNDTLFLTEYRIVE
jgi:hypothetical protein